MRNNITKKNMDLDLRRYGKNLYTKAEESGDSGGGGGNPQPSPQLSSNELVMQAKYLIEGTFGFSFDENDEGQWVESDFQIDPGDDVTTLGNPDTADYGIWTSNADDEWCYIYVTEDELKTIKDITDVDRCQVMWIDLGLPSGRLWADRNMGANNPEDSGYYYYGGIVEPVGNEYTSYIYSYIQTTNNDAYLRAPTQSCFEELIANTTHEETQVEGVNGMRFISKTNQNSIFIPYCGEYNAGAPEVSPGTDSASLLTSTPSTPYLMYFNILSSTSSVSSTPEIKFIVGYIENACPIRQCIEGTSTQNE